MAKQSRTKKQARADRAGLKKLRDLGLIGGKLDLRKAPSQYRRKQLRKFADVVTGKASVVKPRDPAKYKDSFRVVGPNVIVPRQKGEKIATDKRGRIVRTKRTKGRTSKRVIKPGKIEDIKRPGGAVIFVVPFRRGKHGDIDYRRFTYDGLKKFFAEYLRSKEQKDDWLRYVEEETIDYDTERDLDRYITGSVTAAHGTPTNSRRMIRKLSRELDEELADE